MSILGDERSGSGLDLFLAGRFIFGGTAAVGGAGRAVQARMPALGFVLRAAVLTLFLNIIVTCINDMY